MNLPPLFTVMLLALIVVPSNSNVPSIVIEADWLVNVLVLAMFPVTISVALLATDSVPESAEPVSGRKSRGVPDVPTWKVPLVIVTLAPLILVEAVPIAPPVKATSMFICGVLAAQLVPNRARLVLPAKTILPTPVIREVDRLVPSPFKVPLILTVFPLLMVSRVPVLTPCSVTLFA